MHFDMKSYLKSNHNHTAKQTCNAFECIAFYLTLHETCKSPIHFAHIHGHFIARISSPFGLGPNGYIYISLYHYFDLKYEKLDTPILV